MTRQLIGFVAAVTCLGFFMFAMPAGATSQGCPQETPYYCDPGPCELGTCAVDESQCIYSPAPEGKPCTYGGVFLGGRCDGAGSCGPPCDDRDHDSSCDPMQPAMHSSTCEGDYVAQDPTSGLCWEKYMTNEPYSMYHDDAVDICANSDAGGYFDWRLPTIDELRSIIVGCPDRELGGACQVSDPTCLEWDQCSSECGTTTCPNPLPGQQRHTAPFLEDGGTQAWSSSPDPSNPGAYWGVNYYYAIIQTYGSWAPHVRCVRDVHAGSGGPTQEVISDSTPGDSWNQHVFNVEPGSQFSVTFETHSGSAFYFVEWDQPGGFGGNQCNTYVTAGQTDSCDNLTVDASATEAYVSVNGLQSGVDYTITVDYVAPGGTSCTDSDGDGICDSDDICPGSDDTLDTDGDGTPDGCDSCPNDVNSVIGQSGVEYCGDCPFDVAGDTQYQPVVLSPDGQVTFGMANWWEDDILACYYTLETQAYLAYFPGCDLDGNGLVELQEVYDMYYSVEPYPTGLPSPAPAFAYQCP